ncbi:flagellar hook-associated protein FlgK [Anaerosacchariphilus polymeriproducens]|uniref:Flagellar hook-associated protein 1 n=1 Tax=Anaerosacchariphilus polymeriproducens TaxID=1812858 RepID=A0A371AQU7_9FIRM|nr:flagellar hook-associated protein FlgK [Anaerosacchariphilus polymeriproducens]RDU21904.1 flagellar hook-associated protein FlgK [Anaerosacchariphilus polymeriproducens]
MAGMGSLYVGASGLRSNQNALNTTAHNLANVDTKGYTRQQVLMSDLDYNTLSQAAISAKQVGLGVEISEVRQVRDAFLDKSHRLETGRQAFYETSYGVISEIETLMGELEGVAFQNSLSALWESMEEFSKDPSNTVNQNLVIQKSSAFIERAVAVQTGLKEYQVNINQQVSDKVDRINKIGEEIRLLNKQISKIESGGVESANDLRDSRNILLDELSAMAKISYSEDGNGVVTVNLEDEQFVTKEFVNKMGKNVDTVTGFVTPVWTHLDSTPVYDYTVDVSSELNTDIGSLKALVLARGDKVGNYADITGITAETYNDTVGMSIIQNIEAEFDQLVHGITTTVNNLLCPNKQITDDFGNVYQVWDEEKGSVGSDGQKPGIELFTRANVNRYTEKQMVVKGTVHTYYVYNEEDLSDTTTQYTTGNIIINEKMSKNGSLMPHLKQDGSVDYDLGSALSNAWTQNLLSLNPNSTETTSFSSYYSRLVGAISSDGYVFSGIAKSLEQTTTSIDNQRQQIIGVSSDEELTNMIKFQNAYNAASRYMNVINEMLELLCTQLA